MDNIKSTLVYLEWDNVDDNNATILLEKLISSHVQTSDFKSLETVRLVGAFPDDKKQRDKYRRRGKKMTPEVTIYLTAEEEELDSLEDQQYEVKNED